MKDSHQLLFIHGVGNSGTFITVLHGPSMFLPASVLFVGDLQSQLLLKVPSSSVKSCLQIFLENITNLLRRLFMFHFYTYPRFYLSSFSLSSSLYCGEIRINKKAIPVFLSDSWIYMCMKSMPNISCCSSSSVFSHGGSVTFSSSGLSLKLTNLGIHQKRLILQ